MMQKNCRSISNGIRLRNLSKTRDRRFLFEWTFRFEPELDDMMHQSIEMGRAFIIREYQQNRCLSCFGKDNPYYFTLPEHKFLRRC
jgi:hypothetical protein